MPRRQKRRMVTKLRRRQAPSGNRRENREIAAPRLSYRVRARKRASAAHGEMNCEASRLQKPRVGLVVASLNHRCVASAHRGWRPAPSPKRPSRRREATRRIWLIEQCYPASPKAGRAIPTAIAYRGAKYQKIITNASWRVK